MDKLSIFDTKTDWLKGEIYIHGVENEVRDICKSTYGSTEMSRRLGVDYNSCLKEWIMGRTPVPLSKMEKIMQFCDPSFKETILSKIDSKELKISCIYSPHKMKFPTTISEDLSYCAGLILGDGTLAGESSNEKGNWNVSILFDDTNHQKIYDEIVKKEFNISPRHYKDKRNCWTSIFSSKSTHWFWRSFFDMHHGYKANKITIPTRILESKNEKLKAAVLQGLFDSDGSITRRGCIQYASTSAKMIEQVSEILAHFGIPHRKSVWLKNEKVLPLYSIVIARKSSVLSFAQHIGFRHPRKASKLAQIALSSSPVKDTRL